MDNLTTTQTDNKEETKTTPENLMNKYDVFENERNVKSYLENRRHTHTGNCRCPKLHGNGTRHTAEYLVPKSYDELCNEVNGKFNTKFTTDVSSNVKAYNEY
jgi:hypothetical protein